MDRSFDKYFKIKPVNSRLTIRLNLNEFLESGIIKQIKEVFDLSTPVCRAILREWSRDKQILVNMLVSPERYYKYMAINIKEAEEKEKEYGF